MLPPFLVIYLFYIILNQFTQSNMAGQGGSSNSLIGMTGGGGMSDIGQLDLEELFVDCYYDVPGMAEMVKNEAANGVGDLAEPDVEPIMVPSPAQPTATTSMSSTGADNNKKRTADEITSGGDDTAGPGGGQLTAKQKLERRERNREHAKRSRLRKKFLLESLQEQIHGLQEQLDKFKKTIRDEIPAPKAETLIDAICGHENQYTPLPMPSGFGPVKTLMEPDFRLMSALSGSQQNFAISDPTLPDNPIVYVSQGFLDLTGYNLDQVLGRNCRFLQGPGTDQSAVDVIRKGISEGIDTSVCLLNYKADGTPFWNQFFVAALRDAENNVVNYVGVQCEVSKAVVEKHMGEQKKK
jgi:PAS domain S-box-containing protein